VGNANLFSSYLSKILMHTIRRKNDKLNAAVRFHRRAQSPIDLLCLKPPTIGEQKPYLRGETLNYWRTRSRGAAAEEYIQRAPMQRLYVCA
jgi:hypothetical protein